MISHGREEAYYTASQSDMDIYESMLPLEHKLCQLADSINFEGFRPIVEEAYSQRGQPTAYAMIAFKLEVLKYFYNLSDRAVVERAGTDVAVRWFLKLPIAILLTDHTLLTRFRARLGKEGYQKLFHELIAQARSAGIVKDKLRLKDATHVLANISIPSTLALLSQIRIRLIGLIQQFDPEASEGYELEITKLRDRTGNASDAVRLNERVELLGDIVSYTRQRLEQNEVPNDLQAELKECVELAEKILSQKKQKKVEREIRSVVDPDALRGKHGVYYDGYVLDVAMDADSELITALNVLPAGGNEACGAVALMEQERSAHHNSPQELSMDGAGFDGAMIRELEGGDSEKMEVFVPPKKAREDIEISGEQFEVVQTIENGDQVKCPQGQVSRYRQRDGDATVYRYNKETCQSCPLVQACCKNIEESKFGRSVRKNDYQAEYDRVRQRSQTTRYEEVRKLHPAIERKLNECVNHHGARRARYRGLEKVPIQMFGTGLAINLKRIVKLLQRCAPTKLDKPAVACC